MIERFFGSCPIWCEEMPGSKTPCEIAAKYLLPALRYLIAKVLIEDYGFSQVAAARALGVTQPAISYYLHSKRGKRWAEKLAEMEEIEKIVNRVAEQIAASKEKSKGVNMCRLCQVVRRNISPSQPS